MYTTSARSIYRNKTVIIGDFVRVHSDEGSAHNGLLIQLSVWINPLGWRQGKTWW